MVLSQQPMVQLWVELGFRVTSSHRIMYMYEMFWLMVVSWMPVVMAVVAGL